MDKSIDIREKEILSHSQCLLNDYDFILILISAIHCHTFSISLPGFISVCVADNRISFLLNSMIRFLDRYSLLNRIQRENNHVS